MLSQEVLSISSVTPGKTTIRLTKTLKILLTLTVSTSICLLTTAHAQAQKPEGDIQTIQDDPEIYRAFGSLSVSAMQQNKAFMSDFLTIPNNLDDNQDWEFEVGYESDNLLENRANQVKFSLRGVHITAPHPPRGEAKNNQLPKINSSPVNPTFVAGSLFSRLHRWGRQEHGGDRDYYGISGNIEYVDPNNDPKGIRQLRSDDVQVFAQHKTGGRPSRSKLNEGAFRSTDSFINYDASSQTLSFVPGEIDVLDTIGGLSGSIDPNFINDPILNTTIEVSDITLQGQAPDGRFIFGGGTISLVDPSGDFEFVATFEEFLIGDTSRDVVLDSFGILTEGSSFNSSDFPSLWMDALLEETLFGATPVGFSDTFIDFSFITEQNLVTLTNNFTQSTNGLIPAQITVSGNGTPVPENSSTLGLLAIGTLGAGSVLLRKKKHKSVISKNS